MCWNVRVTSKLRISGQSYELPSKFRMKLRIPVQSYEFTAKVTQELRATVLGERTRVTRTRNSLVWPSSVDFLWFSVVFHVILCFCSAPWHRLAAMPRVGTTHRAVPVFRSISPVFFIFPGTVAPNLALPSLNSSGGNQTSNCFYDFRLISPAL